MGANEGAHDGNEDGSGDEAGTGTGMGAGTETRTAVAEMGTGTRMGTETETRIRSGRAEKRRRSTRNRTKVGEGMWESGETWVEREKNVEKKGLVQ